MRNFATRLIVLVALVGTIGCDRVSKRLATEVLADAPSRSFLADTVRLEYAENTGAFLSLGAEWPVAWRTLVFGIGNGALLFAMAVVAMRLQWPRVALIGLTLFIAGGASNLIDRLVSGYVVDFVNVGIGPVRTGIFNVADVAILIGAALVALSPAWRGTPEQLD